MCCHHFSETFPAKCSQVRMVWWLLVQPHQSLWKKSCSGFWLILADVTWKIMEFRGSPPRGWTITPLIRVAAGCVFFFKHTFTGLDCVQSRQVEVSPTNHATHIFSTIGFTLFHLKTILKTKTPVAMRPLVCGTWARARRKLWKYPYQFHCRKSLGRIGCLDVARILLSGDRN